jgi:RecB family endonuclease NucS
VCRDPAGPAGGSAPAGLLLALVRLVIARCSVDYAGRLNAHLPSALRLLIVKADGSVLVAG